MATWDVSCEIMPPAALLVRGSDSSKPTGNPGKLRQTQLGLVRSANPGGKTDVLSLSMDDGDVEYNPTPKKRKSVATPAAAAAKKSAGKTPVAGKSKQRPTVRKRNSKVPDYTTGLRALTVGQLVDLIERVIEKHPHIKNDFTGLTPLPDLDPLELNLDKLKKAVFKAFPYTKWGSNRDGFCFRRVKTHLDVFQRECIQQGKTLMDLKQWKSAMEYAIIAWKYVNELPDWDDSSHDKHKVQCYKKLCSYLTNALKQATFERQELEGYIEKFEKLTKVESWSGLFPKDNDNGMGDIIHLAGTILAKLQ